jgi:hypothetical protein
MKLSSPKKVTWWIAVVLGVLGISLHLGVMSIAGLGGSYDFFFVAIGFVLLALGTRLRGL